MTTTPTIGRCPRPFCSGSGRREAEDGFHAIRCSVCGYSMTVRRDPKPHELEELLQRWNTSQPFRLEDLPAALRTMAGRSFFEDRFRLLDAATLLEQHITGRP